MNPQVDDWHRLYGESWKGAIEDDAFAHPAKYARGLIRAIYDHALGEGWLRPGDTVLDPFGGVALGALNAMESGLNWVGMELEERFVLLGNQNIQRWEAVLRARGNGHGSAYLYHGDSRYLGLLLDRRANGCVSSPPYADGCAHTGGNDPHPEHIQGGTYRGVGIQGAVSSPPYTQSVVHGGAGIDPDKLTGNAPGTHSQALTMDAYGTSPAQLGAMRAGSFDAAVSSPPYEGTDTKPTALGQGAPTRETGESADRNKGDYVYPDSVGQLGTERGETFWSAARQVLEQTYQVLAPGAHAIWVCKDFVRDGQRVPFSHQWAQLCVAVGFEWLHEHRAWVVEEYGTQLGFFGEDEPIVKERKSFFRRLAEKNGSPRIDWESVLCFRKGGAYGR